MFRGILGESDTYGEKQWVQDAMKTPRILGAHCQCGPNELVIDDVIWFIAYMTNSGQDDLGKAHDFLPLRIV